MKINLGFEIPVDVEFRNFSKLLRKQIKSSGINGWKPSTAIIPGYRRKGDRIILWLYDWDLVVLRFPSKKLAKMYDEVLKSWTAREELVRRLVKEYKEFLNNELEWVKTWEEMENGGRKD